jgi:hypothetical protein
VRVGDVFTVPLDDARVGFGQVVAEYLQKGHFYVALFEPAFPVGALPNARDVPALPIAFLALSMDAKVHAGHWVVVGNAPLPERLPLPAFKEVVGSPQRVDVVDYLELPRFGGHLSIGGVVPGKGVHVEDETTVPGRVPRAGVAAARGGGSLAE